MSRPMLIYKHPQKKNTSEAEIRLTNALQLMNPFPILADQFVEVQTEHMAEYFKDVRRSLIEEANRDREDDSYDPANIIFEDDFILVCRYLTRYRIERVYNIFCRMAMDFPTLPRSFRIPESLVEKINRIGVVTVQGEAYRVCPKPEPMPTGPSEIPLSDLAHSYLLDEFTSLVDAAVRGKKNIKIGTLADSIEGSSWWLMTARSVDDPKAVVTSRADAVQVYATHKEWSKDDGIICATIQNQFDGMVAVEKTLKYTIGTVRITDTNELLPRPFLGDQYIVFEVGKMDAYFASLRRALVEAVTPLLRECDEAKAEMISEADFISVCRWVTAGRVTRVYEETLFKSPSTLFPEPYITIPKGLSEIINGIGVIMVHDYNYRVIPQPESNLGVPPSAVAMQEFADLIESARKCGFISTGGVKLSIYGSSWWLLSARSPSNPDIIAAQADKVTVYGSHKEWTVLDGFHCALVQNQFDGILPLENTLKWCIGTFYGIPALQSFFDLPADVHQVHKILQTPSS